MSQVDVYASPNIPMAQTPPHSNGSFAPVLIVLAIIFVLVVVSVVVGRICNKRYHKGDKEKSHGKVKSHGKGKKSKQKDNFRIQAGHHGVGGGDQGDIEFGFDKRFASAKVAATNGMVDNHNPHFNFKAPPPSHKMPQFHHGGGGGEPRGPHAVRFADDHIEFRTGH
ncbi:OLC1v1028293C1 [Oldenlandia corymbosa var. corymbosa]|uniref:OLC1v1028293C1 n=1 Tax=Oldenlandia corymbosa var. corymbosa TaxID=529605 RepID=A0AAV1CDE2_OLDCO|nr:OLC1v1028293C1 [Oldenlandia corymbosa var. corymbosa]